jgi:hypothetical protein
MKLSKTRIAAAALALISSMGAITLLASPATASSAASCDNQTCNGLECKGLSTYNCDNVESEGFCVTSKCEKM